MLRYESQYFTPELLREHPAALFAFGDNLQRSGKGGQAVIRHEPNARGIPTKRAPSWDPGAFFVDADMPAFVAAATPVFVELAEHLRAGGLVVWPAEGIGTGRAQLDFRAPRIWASLERARLKLEAIGGKESGEEVRGGIEAHPFVRAALVAFPGAQIVAVRDRDEAGAVGDGEPEGD